MRRRTFQLSVVCLGLAFSAANAAPQQDKAKAKVSHWLWQEMGHDKKFTGEALVYLNEQADLSASEMMATKEQRGQFVHQTLVKTALEAQAPLRAWLDERGVAYRPFWIANMIALKNASPDIVREVAMRDDVLRVVGNPTLHELDPSVKSIELGKSSAVGQNLTRIGADRVWNELAIQGSGIVVAGQDTGVEWTHPALKKKYRGWKNGVASHDYNWHDSIQEAFGGGSSCPYDSKQPCDDHDHGTHTVGTIVGDDGVGNRVGVAPGAEWIACRNMDNGLGKPSTYIECFEFFLAPWKLGGDQFKDSDPSKAPHVINNSWGCPTDEGCEGGEFEPVLKALEAAGIFVVVSAGNDGPDCSTIKTGPAFNTKYVLNVGAMNSRNDTIASFSSRGPSAFDNQIGPHVTAPGVNVKSSVRNGKYASFMWSGTSMAGPHVVGEVALMWSANPKLIGKVQETRDLIIKSAQAKKEPNQSCGGVSGNSIPNNTWGYGIINVFDAVKTSL